MKASMEALRDAARGEFSRMLKRMNDNLRSPVSGVNVCIYNAFGADADGRKQRCAEHAGRCAACIEALLREEDEV